MLCVEYANYTLDLDVAVLANSPDRGVEKKREGGVERKCACLCVSGAITA